MLKRRAVGAIVLLIVFSSILTSVYAIETIELKVGELVCRTIDLVAEDNVTGAVSCIDTENGYTNTVDFWINRPDGSLIARYRDTAGSSFFFVAAEDGVYTLWFTNYNWDSTGNAVKFTLDYLINNSAPPVPSGNMLYILMAMIASSLAVTLAISVFRKDRSNERKV